MATKLDKLELLYGKTTAQKITEANVLVVGAGGIGCEVMKTLSVTGFRRLTVVIPHSRIHPYRSTWTRST